MNNVRDIIVTIVVMFWLDVHADVMNKRVLTVLVVVLVLVIALIINDKSWKIKKETTKHNECSRKRIGAPPKAANPGQTQTTYTQQPAGDVITMMSRDNNSYQSDKDIAIQKPDKVKIDDDAAKANAHKLCDCPGSEPGKVKIDIDGHIPGCRFRKLSTQYATKTSVIPSKIVDGCSLGIVLGEEYY
jgi:hypothetical protein